MKIKVVEKSYDEVMAIPKPKHQKPGKQSAFMRHLIRFLSRNDLKKVNFTSVSKNMDRIPKGQPCLYLMNHSCFTDLEIAAVLIGHEPFHIVCTSDGFVGKDKLMRAIGCFPTQKFVTDLSLVKDLIHVTSELKESVLMYPEASYSFDGTATPLPEGVGKCIKMLKVPVVMIRTHGAFLRDPLYNGLQVRKVDISAEMECILTAEQADAMEAEEINALLKEHFSFDHFREQQEKQIRIDEPFRADGLHRVLFRCPCCDTEGSMKGAGTHITCSSCGADFELDEYGRLQPKGNVPNGSDFTHIPSWYQWEREKVREELMQPDYKTELPVEICMLVDTVAVYKVGEGTLTHTREGFRLTGCDGKLDYRQKPKASYSLYADYFWYEIGDMVCIGNKNVLYYCFPKDKSFPVAKMRLAAEELYK